MSEAADLAQCQKYLRNGSSTFQAASYLLPARATQAVTALYAFCRVADDAIDDPETSIEASLDSLHTRLNAVFAGAPLDFPEDRQLLLAVRHYQLPRVVFDALLEGFSWDAANRFYETLDDLEDYAARVAGSVGVAMAAIMGVQTQRQLARAADLGAAMQLTNICRDVGQDARLGRVYLPRQLLDAAEVDVAELLAEPRFSPAR